MVTLLGGTVVSVGAVMVEAAGEVVGPRIVTVVVCVLCTKGGVIVFSSPGGVVVVTLAMVVVAVSGWTMVLSSSGGVVGLLGGTTISGSSLIAGGGVLTTGHSHICCPVSAAETNSGSRKLLVAGDSTIGWSHPSTKLTWNRVEFRKLYTVNPPNPNAGRMHVSLHT